MGLDFVTKCTPTFKRAWDRGLVELAEPSLFARDPQMQARSYCAIRTDGGSFRQGDEYLLIVIADRVVLLDGETEVARLRDPPDELVLALEGHGCGVGVGIVEKVHPISGCADIRVN
jgi:hypothetical protein